MQRQIRLDILFTGCRDCREQPKYFADAVRGRHSLECGPCGLTTEPWASLEIATGAWNSGDVHSVAKKRAA